MASRFSSRLLVPDSASQFVRFGRSVEEMLRASGRTVQIVPQLSVEDGINAARTVFANCWFDAERCTDGLNALRRYRYDVNQQGERSRKPLHDAASHGADAFRYLAVALKEKALKAYLLNTCHHTPKGA